jgi:hypothetical protein
MMMVMAVARAVVGLVSGVSMFVNASVYLACVVHLRDLQVFVMHSHHITERSLEFRHHL